MCRTPKQMLKSITDTLDVMSETALAATTGEEIDLDFYDTPVFAEQQTVLRHQLVAFNGRLKDLLGVDCQELYEIMERARDELP